MPHAARGPPRDEILPFGNGYHNPDQISEGVLGQQLAPDRHGEELLRKLAALADGVLRQPLTRPKPRRPIVRVGRRDGPHILVCTEVAFEVPVGSANQKPDST